MRARPPVTRVEAGHLVVATALEGSDGAALPPLEVRVPIEHADRFDPTATPGVAPLVALATERGEDLHVEGPVDGAMADAATTVADVHVDDRYDAPADGEDVALLLTGDVDSWAALLAHLDAAPADRVTHLVAVDGTAGAAGAAAAELGLPLVTVGTSATGPLAAVGAALQVGARLRRLVVTGADADRATALGTTRTEVVDGTAGTTRAERVARVAASPLARAHLHVCPAGRCGRCAPCLAVMTELALAGDPDPAAGFDGALDPDAVRGLEPGPELGPLAAAMTAIVEGLPPEREELRRAWSDVWDRAHDVEPRPRWGDDAPPALAGPSVPQRVAAALRATTGQPVAPAPAPLGWRAGAVPLRPAHDAHDEVRALAHTAPGRPHPWAVVEHHIRDGARDGHQADLALALTTHHGAGVCYLPGILWDHLAPPVLGAEPVRTLLRTARARLWWRADGDLEPLRVVEAIEQGCLPLQVMPGAAARALAAALPPALAPLVVDEAGLVHLDLGPAAVAARLGPAVDHLLSGSAEHDLLAGAYR